MRYDADRKARTREQVLKEAVLAIRNGGPDSLGVVGVMKRVGLTHGGFYAHFESREALLMAAMEEMFTGARGTFDRRTKDLAPKDALRAYITFYLSVAHRDARDTGCPLPLLSGDMPRMGEAARTRFTQGVSRLTEAITGKLRELGHPAPESAARSALSEMIGALNLARAMGSTPDSEAILSTTRAALIARLGLGEPA
jgi:TetR/AcrR family transcriptional regulator, transcriptional repressor for nem operon